MQLFDFVRIKGTRDEKVIFSDFIQDITNEYNHVRFPKQKNKKETYQKPNAVRIENLTSKVNFGEYTDIVKYVAKQMGEKNTQPIYENDVFTLESLK